MRLATVMRCAATRAGGRPRPLHLNFELTHQCNLACVYCDRHTPGPSEMGLAHVLQALEELRRGGMASVLLDGGEPLTHPHVSSIVAWLVERRITVRMNTNGILVPRKRHVVRRLAKVKISLDGPREVHDSFRGDGSFARAVRGAAVARELGVEVEFTCTVARHNEAHLETLLDVAQILDAGVVFQPARPSLFLGSGRDGSSFTLEPAKLRAVFARIEELKHEGRPVHNMWSSLRHFRTAPDDTDIPCAAGWIDATLDPAGNLYHCGQLARHATTNNVVTVDALTAFERLPRFGCRQCWCARQVEENYAWGGRLDMLLPPRANVSPKKAA
jgi:MoaA/NifB/PqqE/SkfB family radical SAM enzyme